MKIIPNDLKINQQRSLDANVRRVMKRVYVVQSFTNPKRYYEVKIYRRGPVTFQIRCSCQWQKMGNEGCVHALAAFRAYAAEYNRLVSYWSTLKEARAQKHKVMRLGEQLWVTVRYENGD